MRKFSVVIPVYKVEQYLDECVQSVLNQTYRHMEVILVDDGSPDRCGAMCDQWAKKDDRIRVIHQENGGLSAARNTGIRNATGDYILFLDSDDWWEANDVLCAIAEQLNRTPVDVLSFNYRKSYDSVPGPTYFNEDRPSTQKPEKLSYVTGNHIWVCSSWNKAIRLTLLHENQLYFKEKITSEDIDWSLRLALKAETFSYLNRCVLVYRQRSMSITHSVSRESVEILKGNVRRCVQLLTDATQEKVECLNSYVAYQYGTLVYNVASLSRTNRKSFMKDMRDMKYLLACSEHPKVRMLYRCDRYFGLTITMWLLRLRKKLCGGKGG